MRKLLVVMGLLLAFTATVSLRQETRPQFVPGEVLVKFGVGITDQTMAQALSAVQAQAIERFEEVRVTRLRLGEGVDVEEAVQRLGQLAQVEYAEPNYIYHTMEVTQQLPNDSRFGELWGMDNTGQTGGTPDADIDAPEAWQIQTGDKTVLVAVIDTGVDYTHPDLAANVWTNPDEIPDNGFDDDDNGYVDDVRGWDFANNDNDPMDDNLHGTHVAGTIGAVGNNGLGVAGVNWEVSIMPLKFLDANGSGSTADAIKAVLYAANNGARILSNSWGGGGFSQALLDAIEVANSKGALFVAAAGNEGNNNDQVPNYPSNYDTENVVAVAATDHEDGLADFGGGGGGGGDGCGCTMAVAGVGSNYGPTTVDLGAPGENILSTVPGNAYRSLSGTSMATPHVSGVAALLLAQAPGLSVTELKSKLLDSVDPLPSLQGKMVTGGRLNAAKALQGLSTTAIP
jgi:subtilisin family serine protease